MADLDRLHFSPMKMARGSWLVIGIVGGAIVLAIVAWIIRPTPVSPEIPTTMDATQ